MRLGSLLEVLGITAAVAVWVARKVNEHRRRQAEALRGGPEFARAYKPIEPPPFWWTRKAIPQDEPDEE